MAGKSQDINTLIRLSRWTVEERQRELGALLNREDELIALGRQMELQMVEERRVAAHDPTTAGFLFGHFAGQYRHRCEELAALRKALAIEIDLAREELAVAYRRLKVYEEVQKNRRTQEQTEEARKEQVILDEIGQVQHRRKQTL